MRLADIAMARLINQHIAGTKFTKAAELVKSMGAIQAQDYAMSKWGIGLRLQNAAGQNTMFFESRVTSGSTYRC